jgi:hypothetical protein
MLFGRDSGLQVSHAAVNQVLIMMAGYNNKIL